MTRRTTLRPLTLPEVETLLDWAGAEGWNPGLADAQAFHAADPFGFIGCLVDEELAAGISAIRYGESFGFIGLYIASPAHRGQGYGRRVWDAGMQHLGNRTIGLDGVPEQQANYRSIGFIPAYETHRWSGTIEAEMPAEVTTFEPDPASSLFSAILSYDRAMFPDDRSAFLTAWVSPPRISKVMVRDGRIVGYTVCRQCLEGWKIGPLFADTLGDAELLLRACAVEAPGAQLQIDVPDMQPDFTARLQDLGFSQGFTTARMYRGETPQIHMDKVFGITTLELG